MKIVRSTKLDPPDDDRLMALVKKERRTISGMIRILIVDGMNERERSEVIRQVFGGEQDDE